jgi:hypothetical protein
MLEKTHARIAREIARRLNLDSGNVALLESGSVNPDSFIPFPHHKGRDDLILSNTFDARALFLENDDEAFIKLGEACHFLADKWTLRPRIDIKHFKWESEIESASFENDQQFLKELRKSPITSKAKIFYEKLLTAITELANIKDCMQTKPLITELIEVENAVLLAQKQAQFLLMVASSIDVNSAENFKSKLPHINKTALDFTGFIPFPLLSHIMWITREGTRASTYSTPSIDLNLSLRLCLLASYFVLQKDERNILNSSIIQWNKVPANWKKAVYEHGYQALYGDSSWRPKPNYFIYKGRRIRRVFG